MIVSNGMLVRFVLQYMQVVTEMNSRTSYGSRDSREIMDEVLAYIWEVLVLLLHDFLWARRLLEVFQRGNSFAFDM